MMTQRDAYLEWLKDELKTTIHNFETHEGKDFFAGKMDALESAIVRYLAVRRNTPST